MKELKKVKTKKLNGEFTNYGKEAIEKNKYGVVILSGGQGSRLKINGPKGCVLIDKGDEKQEIFKIHVEKMKFTKIPLFIMVSRENESDTIEYFEKNNYFKDFGYNEDLITIFEQEEWPLLKVTNREKLRIDGEVKYGSSGHGGFYKAISKTGVREKIDELGIEYLYITNVDNILQRPVDLDFIGMAYKNKIDVTVKSVKKINSQEKVGLFVQKSGKLSVLEYTEISEELSNKRDSKGELYLCEANIMTQILSKEFIERAAKLDLPIHEQYKKKWGEEFIKRETLLFDAFPLAETFEVVQVSRQDEFAPIKNLHGEDSLDTATLQYLRYLRKEEAKAKKDKETLEFNI